MPRADPRLARYTRSPAEVASKGSLGDIYRTDAESLLSTGIVIPQG